MILSHRQFTSLTKKVGLCLLVILILGALGSRLSGLQTLPRGLYVDESSIGYNAWSITQTGADEHGISWPIYFKAFGEWKNPVFIYSQALLFLFLKPTVTSLRLGSSLWGISGVLILGILAWMISKSKTVTLASVLLMLSNPWHWLQSRVVFEAISLPTVLLATFLCVYLFETRQKLKYAYYVSLCAGLLFYTYTSARFLAPALIGIFCVLWLKKLKFNLVGVVSLFGIALLPAYVWEKNFPGSLLFAYNRVSLGITTNEPWLLVKNLTQNYLLHWTPEFLFGSGDGYLRHMIGWHSGLLWASLPVIFLGLIVVSKQLKHSSWAQFLWLSLLLAPLPSAITTQAPHGIRSLAMLPILMIFGIYGWHYLVGEKLVKMSLLVVIFVAFGVEMTLMQHYLSQTYVETSTIWFESGAIEQFEVGKKLPPPYYMPDSYRESLLVSWLYLRQSEYQDQLLSQTDSQTSFITALPTQLKPGTYILNQSLCDQLKIKINQFDLVYENYQGCVAQVK